MRERALDTIWKIRLLGGVSIARDGTVINHFRTRKTAELLAYLAYHSRRSHPRDLLIELLWPECDVDAGRHSLNVALSSLRQQLQPSGKPEDGLLVSDRYAVRVQWDRVETDVQCFEQALDTAAKATSQEVEVGALEAAVALYSGALLPGFYEDWVIPEQQRLDELYFQALKRLTSLLEAQGELSRAVQCALRAVSVDRLREEAHQEVIRLYCAAGRNGAAQQQLNELERLLREELGTEPSRETRGLLTRTPPRAPAVEATLAPRASSADAGAPEGIAAGLEPIGGAVPIGSRFYVVRDSDAQCHNAITRGDSMVLLKGARQVGKSSLLARGLQGARAAGVRAVLSHLQIFNAAHLETADTFLCALAENLAEGLDLDVSAEEFWDARRGPNPNFRRFMRREVLGKLDGRLVWGLDEVDRLFDRPYCSEVFGLFRSWHDERALEPDGPWASLTVVMAYSTEAHLFITDVNQSPFNVGTRLGLEDLSRDQVEELNLRHGGPLRDASELERFYRLFRGQPYLARLGLHEMAAYGLGIAVVETRACEEGWVFGAHLRRLFSLISRDPELADEVRNVLHGRPLSGPEVFYRLRSAGIVDGPSSREAHLRCPLYEHYLRRQLL